MSRSLKKFHILIPAILLVAASCNQQAQVQPAPTPNPTPAQNLQYKNNQYGFSIDLQNDWKGYQVLNKTWEGTDLTNDLKVRGPMIVLRHPKWTDSNHYEDIPVMVFTSSQWNWLLAGHISLGAAPILPSKLAQNNLYFFALPARYNYEYASGWEEADQIVHTLKVFNAISPVQ